MSLEAFAESVQLWLRPPYNYFALTCAVLLLLLYVTYAWRRAHRGIVPFSAEGGRVEIAPQTVRAIIQHAATGVEGVERAVCRVYPARRKLRILIMVHLQATARLQQIEVEIKRRVRLTLHNQFGFEAESIDPIDIRVTRILGDLPEAETAPAREFEMDPYDQLTRFDEDDGFVVPNKPKRK